MLFIHNIYITYGFFNFPNDFDNDAATFCDTLFICYWSSLLTALSQEGLGKVMVGKSYVVEDH
jgi:hypothetical protein